MARLIGGLNRGLMAANEAAWFVGLFGARRSAHRISVPLRYIGPEVLTDVELTIVGGEDTVGDDEEAQLSRLAPGDRFELALRTSDAERHPLQVVVELIRERTNAGLAAARAAGRVGGRRPKLTER